jgi:hypothetical protein
MKCFNTFQIASIGCVEHPLQILKNTLMLWSEKDLNHGKGLS